MKLWGGDSDKRDKTSSNKKFRRRNKMDAKLSVITLEDMFRHHHIRDVSDTWNFRSDGLAGYMSFLNKKYHGEEYTKEEIAKYKSK